MKPVKTIAQVSSCLLILVVGVAFGQFKQGLIAHSEVRDYLINEWSQGDVKREELASIFKRECIIGKPTQLNDLPSPVITIEECSKNNDTHQIVTMLHDNQVLKTIAWPLSIFN